jgi:hypothetical protein
VACWRVTRRRRDGPLSTMGTWSHDTRFHYLGFTDLSKAGIEKKDNGHG